MTSDDHVFTHDAGVSAYDDVATDGITLDDEGEASFDWNEIPVVELAEPPHQRAFDTEQFYKIEGATIARPIKQPYQVGDSVEWYKKPADELRDAAWTADNAPYPLEHPATGMVKDVADVHGFWKAPRYDAQEDRLRADLYVPTNDDEARAFIEEHQDVSVGFYNRLHEEYDGDTGDLTDDEVDGFQTDLYIDHVAGVKRGRCSSEEGCGLDHDGANHGEIVVEQTEPDLDEADVDGDGESTVEEDADCTPCTSDMSNDTDTDDQDGFDINVDLDDLTLDTLAEQFDAVADLRESRDEMAESLEEIRADLDDHGYEVAEDECPCETVDEALHEAEEMESDLEDLREELDEYRAEEKEEALDELAELGADREEFEEDSLSDIREEIDRREEVMEDLDVDTKGVGPTEDDEDEADSFGKQRFGRGYAAEPQA